MTKHTVVIEFSGKEPAYSASMELLGGNIVAVCFSDALEEIEQLESVRDDLLEALENVQRRMPKMTNHIDTCAAILSQCMRITAQGKWHVFCEYSAHTNELCVNWESAKTNYSVMSRERPEGFNVYLSHDKKAADKQLAAIRTELDNLEGGE